MKTFYNNVFKNYILLMLTLFITEILFRVVFNMCVEPMEIFNWSLLRVFLGINVVSLVLALVFSLMGRIAGNILSFVVTLFISIYSIVQVHFKLEIGEFASLGVSTQAGAIKDYVVDFIKAFKIEYALILVPVVLLLLFYIFVDGKIKRLQRNDEIDFSDKFDSEERKATNIKNLKKDRKMDLIAGRVLAVIALACFVGGYYWSLTSKVMQDATSARNTMSYFTNPDNPMTVIKEFGTTVFLGLDIKNFIAPAPVVEVVEEFEKIEQVESDYTRYIDDSLWNKVKENEKQNKYRNLHNYYSSLEITDKNDYTGMFKGKNLIVIMMESTNNIVLDEKYFPNMAKLAKEGWYWENSYSPRNSCSTGNNEMSGMVSLYTINNSCTANYYKNNKYPHAIFNLFNNAGYATTSYHNYTEQYYYRKTIHPNMGSNKYYGVQALGIPYSNVYQEWPSDVELVEKVLGITESQEQFMAWMTTVSAHRPYTQSSELGNKHLALFKDTRYNMSLKRYMSKLKEFDLAIGALLDGLEKQGKLDDTVIVLFSDHYPYGLDNATLNKYFDYNVNNQRNMDRTPFIIYNSEVSPQKFNEYTSYMNIVPTVANLFGLDYDPRLYAGKDILSDTYENRVIFADGSWKDDKGYYSASSGKVYYYDQNDKYTNEEVKAINVEVSNRIKMSNNAIKYNYFNYLENEKKKYIVNDEVNTTDENKEQVTE